MIPVADDAESKTTDFERAWTAMILFDEHTWGAANPWDSALEGPSSGDRQWSRKALMAYEAFEMGERVLERELRSVSDELANGMADGVGCIVMVNSASYPVQGPIDVWIPYGPRIAEGVILRDGETKEAIPYVVVRKGLADDPESAEHSPLSVPGPRPRGFVARFVGPEVPGMGYRTLTLDPTGTTASTPERKVDTVLETPYYRIELDVQRGAIQSIYDKETACDLVNPESHFRFGEYVYDQYTMALGFNHLSIRMTGSATWLLGCRSRPEIVEVTRRTSTSVYEEVVLTWVAPWIHRASLTVRSYPALKRVDCRYRLNKLSVLDKEAIYLAFPFASDFRTAHYGSTGGTAGGDLATVPGSCDWMHVIQDWVAMGNDAVTAVWTPIEAPLIELGDIHVPYNPFEGILSAPEPRILFSYVLNNIWDTNFPAQQGGELEFHYGLTSYRGPYDGGHSHRLGAVVSNPIRAVWDPRPSTNFLGRFWDIQSEDHHIIAVAIHRHHWNRIMLRLQEVGNRAGSVQIRSSQGPIRAAWETNLVGDPIQTLVVDDDGVVLAMKPGGISTLMVESAQ